MVPMASKSIEVPEGYEAFLERLRHRVLEVQSQVQRAVNRQLIALYWKSDRPFCSSRQ